MPNFSNAKLNTDDTHSINVSFYKPEGVSMLWSWFKNRSNSRSADKSVFNHSNNIKLKLNADDLNKLKNNGIDLEKLQKKANSKNLMPQGNIFVIPKHHLGIKENELLNMMPNFIKKKDTVSTNKKIFERLVVATSTVSVKSKQSFVSTSYKYARSNSHKSLTTSMGNSSSKASVKVGVRSITHFDTRAKRFKKNILLKSVPTNIMKCNTERKIFFPIYVGRKKTENKENVTNQVKDKKEGCDKNITSNVIPMLIKKIKSMEEHLSDIEVTTKKINEAVSQQHIFNTSSTANQKMDKCERNVDSMKSIVSHKIYSKNTHYNKKSKLKQRIKRKPKIRINPNAMFLDCNSSNCNDLRLIPPPPLFLKKGSKYENKAYSNNEDMLDLPQQQLNYQNKFHGVSGNVVKNNFQESSEVRCEIMLKLLKALSEAKNQNADAENQQEKSKPLNYDNHVVNSNEVMDIKLESKPTFNWKHKSLSSASETQLDTHKLKAKESIKHEIKKHLSVPLKTDMNSPTRKYQTLHDLDNSEDSETVKTDHLINKDSKDNENIFILTAKSQQAVNHLMDILVSEGNINLTADTRKNSSKNITALISETPTSKPSLTIQRQVENHPQKYSSNDSLKCSLKTRSDFSLAEENQFLHTTTVQDDMCKISIKDSTNKLKHVSAPENAVTNVMINNPKKEPKVSITILVEDGIKDRVKITSNLLNENELSDKIRCKDNTIIRGDGDHRGNIIESKQRISEYVRGNTHKIECITDDNVPFVFTSAKNTEINLLNKSCPEELVFGQTNKINEVENLNLRNGNGYLNQEQRKQYEKKLLEIKINNNKMLFSHMGQKETNSCMDLTYNPELSRNENESFLMGQSSICASVKHSILCNESMFSSADISFPRKRRGSWSLESLKSENKVSCNFLKNDQICSIAKQSESYNFNNSPPKEERQPFFIINNNKNEADVFKNNNQHVLDQKRRSCRYGITLIRDPIPEEIEKEMFVKETDTTDLQQLEEGDNIKVKADMYNSKLLDDLDIIECEVKDADPEEPDNSNSAEYHMDKSNYVNSTLKKSVKSSVSVQTDWSLLGITMEHFNSDTFAKSVSTNTVSVQTDDTASFNKISCQENSTQTITEHQNLISSEFNEENVMELKMSSVLITVLKDGEQVGTHSECKSYNINMENNCPEQNTGKTQISEGGIGQLNGSLEFLNYNLQRDFNIHQCTIPCFPSLSNETVLSDISESNYKSLLSTNLISEIQSAFSKIQHLNEEDIYHNIEQGKNANQIVPVNKVQDLNCTDENHTSEDTVKSLPYYVVHEEAPLTENTFKHTNIPANDSMQVISDQVSLIPPCETTTNANHLDKKPCAVKVPVSDMIRNVDLYNNSYKSANQRDLHHHHNRVTTKKSTKDFVVGVYNFECESVRRGNSIFTNIADSYTLDGNKTQTHIW